jgi:hypothetical protein
MKRDTSDWAVIVLRRVANGHVVPEVLEVRDEITAQRYFDKMVAGPDHVAVMRLGSCAHGAAVRQTGRSPW